jgi:hypothetical protein
MKTPLSQVRLTSSLSPSNFLFAYRKKLVKIIKKMSIDPISEENQASAPTKQSATDQSLPLLALPAGTYSH